MKVSDLLKVRQTNWRELEHLCGQMEGRSRKALPAATVSRFSTLYRAACADLALADAYQLPPDTVQYLHQLVGRAHNQLYRARVFNVRAWTHELFVRAPRQLFADNYLRLAFLIFWGIFGLSGMMAYHSPKFAERVIGRAMMDHMEENFSEPVYNRDFMARTGMAGFYIYHNTGIGLKCFAFGLVLGIGGLFALTFNAALLGAVFGHMATTSSSDNFYHFVTAHGPFELTAVVLGAAAGMRLGFSLVDTKGYTRTDSLRRAANEAMPTVGAMMLLFFLAAMIEGFLSPSAAPYGVKAFVAILSSGLLMFYFVILGYPRDEKSPVTTRE